MIGQTIQIDSDGPLGKGEMFAEARNRYDQSPATFALGIEKALEPGDIGETAGT